MNDTNRTRIFRRHIAITGEHGSWVFLFSPLIIGIVAGGRFTTATVYLIIAALTGFLIRQPMSIAVKVLAHRRDRRDLPAAIFWMSLYALIGAVAVIGLVLSGFGYLLYLVIPGVPVFIWHLYLIYRRSERRQMGIEVVASGVLALSATAAY